jgi:hypothetical protein
VWVKETNRQLYLGGYALEEHAAEAFDGMRRYVRALSAMCMTNAYGLASPVACLKAKGAKAKINNPLSKYKELMPYLASVTMEELVMAIRR